MRTFKDKAGREWEVAVTIGLARRAKAKLKLDLLEPEADATLERVLGSPSLRAELILLAIEKQMADRTLSAADVEEAFDGTVIAAARTALMEDWADFFRQDGQPHRMRLVERSVETVTLAEQAAANRMDEIDVEQEVSEAVSTHGAMSGTSPES